MNKITSEDYVKSLMNELGEHFYYEPYYNKSRGWVGFIYCACSEDSHYNRRSRHEIHIHGAVARLEDMKLWFLDTRINHHPNGDNKEPYVNPSVRPIPIGDPNFEKKFLEIIPWHQMLVEYFNSKTSVGRGTTA